MKKTDRQIIYSVLRYNDVSAAADWLCRVFQFQKSMMVGDPDAVFATIKFGPATVMLSSSPAEGLRLASPKSLGTCTAAIHVYVADVDSHYQKSVAAGAEIVSPLQDTEHGSRDYNARDLEGHIWAFSTYQP